jgi:GNAT superfamily N-acetyltransferase
MKPITITPALKSDKRKLVNVIKRIFPDDSWDDRDFQIFLFKYCYFDGFCLKIMCGKKAIGVNMLHHSNITDTVHDKWCVCDLNPYLNKKGLHSDFFGIEPKYQRQGIGTMVVNYIKENFKDYDYVWGYQRYDVSNIDFFLKYRKIVAKKEEGIYTIQDLK